MRFRVLAPIVLVASAPAHAVADSAGFEDIAKLEARVLAALDADMGQPGGPVAPIDRRLKLAACPKPVTIDPPALGALPLRCEPLGWRIRVPLQRVQTATIPAGTPAGMIQTTPVLIKRGDPVQLTAAANGFSVSAAAVAQEDGHAGGHVRVKTDPRGPVIVGDVVDTGLVRVASF